MSSPLKQAAQAIGSYKALARAIGVKQSTVGMWETRGRIPAEYCLAIEQATGVSRYDQRPDVFGPAEAKPAARQVDYSEIDPFAPEN